MPPPLTLRDVVTGHHPGARILATSQPLPVLGGTNVLAYFDDGQKAHAAVQRAEAFTGRGHAGTVTFTPTAWPRAGAGDDAAATAAGLFAITAALVFTLVSLTMGSLVTGGAAGLLAGAVVAAVGWSMRSDARDRARSHPLPHSGVTLVALVDVPRSEVVEATRQLRPGSVELLLVDAAGRPG